MKSTIVKRYRRQGCNARCLSKMSSPAVKDGITVYRLEGARPAPFPLSDDARNYFLYNALCYFVRSSLFLSSSTRVRCCPQRPPRQDGVRDVFRPTHTLYCLYFGSSLCSAFPVVQHFILVYLYRVSPAHALARSTC